jgi:hypothetical protein
MLEAQEMYLFSSDIAKNPSDPNGQPDLIEKRPCALRGMFVFDFLAISWRAVAQRAPAKPVSDCASRSSPFRFFVYPVTALNMSGFRAYERHPGNQSAVRIDDMSRERSHALFAIGDQRSRRSR